MEVEREVANPDLLEEELEELEEESEAEIDIDSIKLTSSLAAHRNLELFQMDFDTAFLNAHLKEDIYIKQPESFQQWQLRIRVETSQSPLRFKASWERMVSHNQKLLTRNWVHELNL